jgi:phage tail P2-like protein
MKMSDAHGLTKENLLFAFPGGLRENQSLAALGNVTAEALAKRPAEIALLALYPRIDELPEDLLDILARDFKVDWWDVNYSLEEKRRTLKDSWRVHKMLGTKAAVETAISAIYPRTKVLEWFEYGGEPYHFRLDINITNDSIDSVKQRRVLELLNYYKSLRSHNDGVTYFVEAQPAIARAVPAVAAVQESARVTLALSVPMVKPVVRTRAGIVTAWQESAAVRMELPTPTVQSAARARVGAATGLWEAFTASLTIPHV